MADAGCLCFVGEVISFGSQSIKVRNWDDSLDDFKAMGRDVGHKFDEGSWD